MRYCSRCVMPDTKPGVTLDEDDVCNACRNVEIKKTINWELRKKDFKKFCNEIKKNNKGPYDCVVAVSGGKDSVYQVWYMKDVLKMRVLAVCMLPHLRTREGVENLNNMISKLGIDTITISLKPSSYKAVRRKAFKELGEPNWAEHLTVFAGVARIALAYKAPLTVWGEDIAVEFGGRTSDKHTSTAEDAEGNDLIRNIKIAKFYDDNLIQKKFTFFYHYPPVEEMKKYKLRSIYLGYYEWWDGYKHYLKGKEVIGLQGRRDGPLSGNYLDYDNIDEKLCEINIWMKYLKFGFWRPTDQTCYQIWNGRMAREKAVEIVNSIQDEFPIEYFQDFLDFHDLTQEEFWEIAESFRNLDVWEKSKGKWRLKYPLTNEGKKGDILDKKVTEYI